MITVIDKYKAVIHNMLVLSSCTVCNRLCKVGLDCMVHVCFVGLELHGLNLKSGLGYLSMLCRMLCSVLLIQ